MTGVEVLLLVWLASADGKTWLNATLWLVAIVAVVALAGWIAWRMDRRIARDSREQETRHGQ